MRKKVGADQGIHIIYRFLLWGAGNQDREDEKWEVYQFIHEYGVWMKEEQLRVLYPTVCWVKGPW
jgi:hypothetical protein